MKYLRSQRNVLAGKVIDVHAHVGVSLKMYCRNEYPYAQSAESLYYRQLSGGVDVNVVFPFGGDLYFEPAGWKDGRHMPAADPLSSVPYGVENRLLLQEIYDWRPVLRERFLPFISVDPGRAVDEQARDLALLDAEYPIYGIKINPVSCGSPVAALRDTGRCLLSAAAERNWPLLFHAVPSGMDDYSQAEIMLELASEWPELRFCLAHSLQFRTDLLDHADALSNVWVDTSALKIQVDANLSLVERGEVDAGCLLASLADGHLAVMADMCARYPHTIIWGTDAPAYIYICSRRDRGGMESKYHFVGRYEDEIAALRSLDPAVGTRVCNTNTLDFIFGCGE